MRNGFLKIVVNEAGDDEVKSSVITPSECTNATIPPVVISKPECDNIPECNNKPTDFGLILFSSSLSAITETDTSKKTSDSLKHKDMKSFREASVETFHLSRIPKKWKMKVEKVEEKAIKKRLVKMKDISNTIHTKKRRKFVKLNALFLVR